MVKSRTNVCQWGTKIVNSLHFDQFLIKQDLFYVILLLKKTYLDLKTIFT